MEIEHMKEDLEEARQSSLVDMQKIARRYNDLIDRYGIQMDFYLDFTTSQTVGQRHHRHIAIDITTELTF